MLFTDRRQKVLFFSKCSDFIAAMRFHFVAVIVLNYRLGSVWFVKRLINVSHCTQQIINNMTNEKENTFS